MDQERTIYKIKDVSKFTGEILLRTFSFMIEKGWSIAEHTIKNKKFHGEVSWNRFLANNEKKEVKTFLTNELNLDQLKDYLKEYKIGFSSKELPDGKMMLAFEVKNHDFVKKAFEETLGNLTKVEKAEELTEKLVKSPENMNVEDKLKYFKKEEQKQINALYKETKIATKTFSKEMEK